MGGNQLGRGWSAIGGWGIKLLGVGRGDFFFDRGIGGRIVLFEAGNKKGLEGANEGSAVGSIVLY